VSAARGAGSHRAPGRLQRDGLATTMDRLTRRRTAPLLPAGAAAPAGPCVSSLRRGIATVELAGETVELFAARALHWPRERALFVADVHLGKGAAFRAGGVPLPRGATASDLARLDALVARTGAARLVVLGDLLHAAAGRVAALDAAFLRWRAAHPGLSITLVRGNHDTRAGDPPRNWNVDVVSEPHPFAPFLLCHEPATPPTGHALCGHVHPGVRVGGAGESLRLPCFVVGRRRTLLPAFGRLTGLALVDAAPGETIVAIGGSRLFPLRSDR
jgi:DNA ligase-associated metallophosphoesterase